MQVLIVHLFYIVSGAITMANRTRVQQHAEMCRRLDAIRQAPEESLWMNVPQDFPRPNNAIRAPAAPAQPPVNQQANWSDVVRRGRSESRGRQSNRGRPRFTYDQNNIQNELKAEMKRIQQLFRQMDEQEAMRGRPANFRSNQNGKGKGKGKGKSNKRQRKF